MHLTLDLSADDSGNEYDESMIYPWGASGSDYAAPAYAHIHLKILNDLSLPMPKWNAGRKSREREPARRSGIWPISLVVRGKPVSGMTDAWGQWEQHEAPIGKMGQAHASTVNNREVPRWNRRYPWFI
jgi:hypothetical protein